MDEGDLLHSALSQISGHDRILAEPPFHRGVLRQTIQHGRPAGPEHVSARDMAATVERHGEHDRSLQPLDIDAVGQQRAAFLDPFGICRG